ncbi:DUF362 domain-containing protein [Dethiobacter alkaliphilus]|uniref:4Fe-4S ferredoxin-type domain-containing protein n=1 Tax=Dethiobacter alkaliphilus AHT 1 TaxID=555088 RepID=C0GJS2_DETAL|nr:DUF362 domain-containing protein [Dethiobacter alkaliphilus]EEG76380.1 protein of unknown function DUF362 [Dethiobacter alkaliphilus AHT 1]
MDNRVFVFQLDDYEPAALYEAMGTLWRHLQLEEEFSDKKVLVKPNLLVGAPPQNAVCTHPEVVRSVLQNLSAKQVQVGDSPGFGSTGSVARTAGIHQVCSEENVELTDFCDPQRIQAPQTAKTNSVPLSSAVVGSDEVINIAKLKTHGLTRYTGAVKNLFGCLPGKLKGQMHLRMEEIDRFSDYLLDVYLAVNPAVSIVDGILAMEGSGPRTGDPRKAGVLLAGKDAVAVDTVACHIIGLDPATVPTLQAARRRGIGCSMLEQIEVIGASLDDVRISDFKTVSGSHSALKNLSPFLKRLLRNQLTAHPKVKVDSCISCKICQHACPAGAITMEEAAQIEEGACIRCYCCQEMCPEGAIELKYRGLGRLLR